ncbi:MAG: hypothetical protein LBK59_04245 [Bifidobacteriaceae bacterium]|nr:hypothetical protein [Bifidobacteriaceae bacterium]
MTRAASAWARAAALAGVAILAGAGIVAGLDAPAVAASARPGVCTTDDTGAVTLVIDYHDLGADTETYCVTGLATSAVGADVLTAAGVATQGTVHDGPSFVCRVQGYPAPTQTLAIPGNPSYTETCTTTPPTTAHWSYWWAAEGESTWTYATRGLAASRVKPGGFEGWSFSLGASGSDAVPPRTTPERVAAPPSARPGDQQAAGSSGVDTGSSGGAPGGDAGAGDRGSPGSPQGAPSGTGSGTSGSRAGKTSGAATPKATTSGKASARSRTNANGKDSSAGEVSDDRESPAAESRTSRGKSALGPGTTSPDDADTNASARQGASGAARSGQTEATSANTGGGSGAGRQVPTSGRVGARAPAGTPHEEPTGGPDGESTTRNEDARQGEWTTESPGAPSSGGQGSDDAAAGQSGGPGPWGTALGAAAVLAMALAGATAATQAKHRRKRAAGRHSP